MVAAVERQVDLARSALGEVVVEAGVFRNQLTMRRVAVKINALLPTHVVEVASLEVNIWHGAVSIEVEGDGSALGGLVTRFQVDIGGTEGLEHSVS